MSDVEVPFGDKPAETATLLLAAAMEKYGNTSAVRTGDNVFVVPEEIAKAAEAKEEPEPPKPPAKKTAKKASKK